MVTDEQHSALAEIPRRYRKRLDRLIHDNEDFVLAIDTRSGRLRSKHDPKLVLTDQ